jgi:biopolymer transport protein ExbD
MSRSNSTFTSFASGDMPPVLKRRPMKDESDMDITPMIDITFLLLIFFLVSSTPDPQKYVALAPARYGDAVSMRACTIITLGFRSDSGPADVYTSDGKIDTQLLPDDLTEQESRIRDWVEEGILQQRTDVLLKAEMGVPWREVARVARVAGEVEGVRLHDAVLETNE